MAKRSVISFDRVKCEFVGITPQVMADLQREHPLVNVPGELSRMTTWLLSKRGLRRKGTLDFIRKWLDNAFPVRVIPEKEEPISKLNYSYLEDLWKQSPLVLKINSMKTAT